ncbi:rod shape-determining protein RodA [Bacteroidia bacterium]|nr:rod shape-determining protein RodA [Bacteroidia bacterium]
MNPFNKIFRGDRTIWVIFLFLALVSIIEVYSASSMLTFQTDDYWRPISRHVLFLFIGTIVVLATHVIPPKYFSVIGVCLVATWGLVLAAHYWGGRTNDASRWLTLAGLKFQPSEIAKLCLIVYMAFILSKKKSDDDDENTFWWILIAGIITCGVIFIDNGSTAILLFLIVILMMFIGQISWKRLLSLLAVMLILMVGALAILKNTPDDILRRSPLRRSVTWKHRIFDHQNKLSVTDATFEINDKNFQESHGYIAIANGGVFGRFPGNSTERDVLPQAYSDFIYAIIIEEMGLIIGGLGVLFLYTILFIRSGIIAKRSEKNFSKYLVIGCSLMLVSQALANMAVAVGLIPVTGQPMPLMSRGGTSTLITCVYFGIILSVSRDNLAQEREIEAELEAEKAREMVPEMVPEADVVANS